MSINPNIKQTLSVYPYLDEIGYSDPISSEKLNKQLESLQESTLRTLIRTQEINNSLSLFEAAVSAQATALGSYYNNLQFNTEIGKAFISAFDTFINSNNSNISLDKLYGYITLQTLGHYSKIPKMEGYDGKVSPQVKILINGTEQPYDSAAYKALDASTKTLWFEQFTPNSEVVFEIQLPPSLTKRFNYIQVDPFPVFGFELKTIQYQNFYGEWKNVTEHFFGTYDPMKNNRAFPTKLYLEPRDFNGSIRIIGQTLDNGFFGFSNIDIGFMDFNDTSQVDFFEITDFRNTSGGPKSYSLTYADVLYYFDSTSAEQLISGNTVITAELIVSSVINGVLQDSSVYTKLDLSTGSTIDLKQFNITIENNQSLYFRYTMKEFNMTTPVFRGVKVEYKRS